jgi:hypothetical protein
MAKQVKRAASEIAQAGMGLAGVAAGAVALAATVDKGIAAEVKNLKNAFTDLAVPIAKLVVPAIRDLANTVREVADWVAGLSPHTKTMIVNFVQVAASVGAAALVISKVAAAISGLASIIAAITAAPFIAIIAVLAAVAAGALLLHRVWRTNWAGIQDKTREVVQAIAGYWAEFKDFLGGLWDGLVDGYGAFLKFALSGTVKLLEALGKITGEQAASQIKFQNMGVDIAMSALKNGGMKTLGLQLKEGLLDAAGALKDELKRIMDSFSLGNGGRAARHGGPAEGYSTAGLSAGPNVNFASELSVLRLSELATEQGKLKSMQDTARFMDAGLRIAAAERIRLEKAYEGSLRQTLDQIGAAIGSAVGKVAGKMGEVGGVLNAGLEGFKSGGIWGAIIGIIAEILGMLQGFQKMVASMNAFFGRWIAMVDKALGPLFDGIISFAEDIGSLIEAITSVTGAFETIGFVMRAIALVLDFVEWCFIKVGQEVLKIFGAHDAKLDAMVKKVEDDMNRGFNEVTPPAKDLKTGLVDLKDTVVKTTEKFGEMLTNMPSGYKLKGAQFRADGATGGTGGGSSWAPTAADIYTQWANSMGTPAGGAYTKDQLDTLNGYGNGSGNNPTPGSGTSSVGSHLSEMTDAEAATWAQIWKLSVELGSTDAEAAAAADAWVENNRNSGGGRGSSSSAATAATGTGGANSGIHQVGGDAAATVVHIHGDVHVGAKNFGDFVKQISEVQDTQAGARRRNTHKAKR